MKYLNKIFIFLVLFIEMVTFAQNNTIDKIGIGNGLSDNYILNIAQDEIGFMWFGTEWGLIRFDGTDFKVFKTDSTKNTISHNGINKILADSVNHLLWIATKGGGLNVFNLITEKFIHYPTYEQTENSTQSKGITDLCFDVNGDIWIATYNEGLKKLNIKDNTISHNFLKNIPLPNNFKIKCIADDHQGNLYIGHWGNGFSVLSTKNLTGKHYEYSPNFSDGLPGNEVMDICIDSKQRVWLGTHSGLAIFHPQLGTFSIIKTNENNPNGLSDDDIHCLQEINGKLWIGTWKGGINILDLENVDVNNLNHLKFKHIVANYLPTGLSSSSIESIFMDSFGNTWLGTYGEGLNVLNHVKPFFNKISYASFKGEQNGLSDKSINTLSYSHDSLLFIGLGNGSMDILQWNVKIKEFLKQKTIHPGKEILCTLTDSKDNIWIGNNFNGLMLYNSKSKSIKTVDIFKDSNWDKYVASIYEDHNNNLWISTNNGIIQYNPETKKTKAFNGEQIGLRDNYIRDIIQDINGNLWIGSAINGVSVVTSEFESIHNFSEQNLLNSNIINHLYKDSQDRIWICTAKGLTVFPNIKNSNYDSFNITEGTGLEDNYIRAIIEGNKDEMWITTNAGISKYLIQSDIVENYTYNDGIPIGTFKNGTVAKTNSGILLFGSQDGICYFNADDSVSKINLPPVVITAMQVYDSKEELSSKSISLPVYRDNNLKYTQNTLSIDFNVLDYGLRNQVEYAYLLQGIDNDASWYQTKRQNNITFHNLPPGDYRFYVKARIHNQEWSNQMDNISFKIEPPIYLTWWAKILYTTTILLICIAILIFYRRKLKLENQLFLEQQSHAQEKVLNKERIQFFTNITHELRTPLTLILAPLEDLVRIKNKDSEVNNKLSLIHKNTNRLLALINQLLEFRKTETSSRRLSVNQNDISSLLQEVVSKFKNLNKNKEVSIDLIIDDAIVLYYDKEVLTIIMDNLISNALKNTPKGNVKIIARTMKVYETFMLEIEVSDTGYGIPEGDLEKIFDRYYQVKRTEHVSGTGIGLNMIKNLVQLHEGSIQVKSKINQGTSFFVRLKMDETYPEAIHLKTDTPSRIEPTAITKCMLIVEDNEDIRNYISTIFSQSFEIIAAFDGQDALLNIKNKVPDIIISDIMMPVMNGIEFCKHLKNDIRTSHIPIILLTAKDTEVDKTEGYSIGADSYLTKPFSSDLLRTRVYNLLNGRNTIAKYFTSELYKKKLSSNSISKLDNEFINQTINIIEDNLEKEKIDISFLAQQLNMSYATFSRKIKAITGSTANDFVRDIKLQKAEQYLISGKYTISEAAFKVGYNGMAYFREAFKKKFGVLPSEYISKLE